MAWDGGPGILAAPAQGSAGQEFFNTYFSATPSPACPLLGDTWGSWIQPQDLASFREMSGKKKKKKAMPQSPQTPGFWAICVPGDRELIICPWDGF